jgi:N-acetylmuramic acid 6-phosphate etherase
MSKEVFRQLRKLSTENRNRSSKKIDKVSPEKALYIINKEDKKVAKAVELQIPYIVAAVKLVVNGLKNGGRLIYVGAGTSGRLGVLDAVECPPTFGTNPVTIKGIIAGGSKAMFKAQEGVEDKEENGIKDINDHGICKKDIVCGIAASLRTPYVIGAMKRAKQLGAKTIFLTTNPRKNFYSEEYKKLRKAVDIAICPEVGPEVIMGSTRMKSGTAQKLVLNMITTTAMIQLGKVYENMMVDLQATNRKLTERGKRVVMIATGVGYEEAEKVLIEARGHVKTAIVMLKLNVRYLEAQKLLRTSNGFVRKALNRNRQK